MGGKKRITRMNGNIVFCVLLSLVCIIISYFLYMRIPADWVCEYNESPSEFHMAGMRGRINGFKSNIAFFTVSCAVIAADIFYILFSGLAKSELPWVKVGAADCLIRSACLYINILSGMIISAMLFLAAFADREYRIIPDQFSLIICITALIRTAVLYAFSGNASRLFAVLICTISPAVATTLLILIVNSATALTAGRTAIGAGDLKLFAAAALALPANLPYGAQALALPANLPYGAQTTALPANLPYGAQALALPANLPHGAQALALPANLPHGAQTTALPANLPYGAPSAAGAFVSYLQSGFAEGLILFSAANLMAAMVFSACISLQIYKAEEAQPFAPYIFFAYSLMRITAFSAG